MANQTFARVRALATTLPGVEESTSYGTPALKVRGKFLARRKEDGTTLVLKCADMDEKEFLLQTAPAIFFETDHYKGWTSFLVHLDRITDAQLFALLEQSWRREAGKKLIAEYDARQAATPQAAARAGGAVKRPKTGKRAAAT